MTGGKAPVGAAASGRSLGYLAFAAGAMASACSDPSTKFTGSWKSNCENYWGVQISPAEKGYYSVTFCGLSGCLQPGDWMPNSRIDGDASYQVVSSSRLRIKHDEGEHFGYRKCGNESSWQVGSGNRGP